MLARSWRLFRPSILPAKRPDIRLYSSTPFNDAKLRQIIESSKAGQKPQPQTPPAEEVKKAETVLPPKVPISSFSVQKDIHEQIRNLPSDQESKELAFSKSLQKYMDNLQETIFHVTRALNDVTGYLSIEKLKTAIDTLEEELKQLKQAVRDTKARYSEAIQRRSDLQKEINELLTRKHSWSGQDVERFTELYKNDHSIQQDESKAEAKLAEAELTVESVQTRLTHSILTRYHEEQIWSDKIRRASTWGTWMIMGVNVLLFAVATFFVEPWKRRRLVNAFNVQVQQKMDSFADEMRSLAGNNMPVSGDNALSAELAPTAPSDPSSHHLISFSHINSWTAFTQWAQGLFAAAKDPGTSFLLSRVDMGIVLTMFVALGALLGGFIHWCF